MRNTGQPSRRSLIAGASAALGLAAAATPARAAYSYRGWKIDDAKLKGGISGKLAKSFEAQIDLIESLPIKPAIMTFFRGIAVDMEPDRKGTPGLYGPGPTGRGRINFTLEPQPPENPVFLHELLHGYHQLRLPNGNRNPQVLRFLEEAKASGAFPANAYMLSNANEYFAMTASVVLWGKAARPPSTRATVKRVQPACYDWIVEEFGLAGV